jgi:hypothetical protein
MLRIALYGFFCNVSLKLSNLSQLLTSHYTVRRLKTLLAKSLQTPMEICVPLVTSLSVHIYFEIEFRDTTFL